MITVRKLVAAQQLTNVSATYYTATNVRTVIDKCTVTNTSAGAIALTLDIVDSGGSAGVTERIISAKSIAAGETYRCPEMVGQVLESGDSIQGLASDVLCLTIRVSGREIT